MLQFVQQFGLDWLQIEEYRSKFCTFYNIDPHMRFIPPVLLQKIQYSLTLRYEVSIPGKILLKALVDRS